MSSSQNIYRRIGVCLCLLSSFLIIEGVFAQKTKNREAERIEKKADSYFVRKDFNRAMPMYEEAKKRLSPSEQRSHLELKMARLYVLLQRDSSSIALYESIMSSADTMLTVNDVCYLLDALRRSDQSQKAEVISRNYAFRSPYSRDQRYMNAVKTLASQRHYYAKGFNEYSVRRLDINTRRDEYWIGEYNGKQIYAGTSSDMHDPAKITYHRSQYYGLKDGQKVDFNFIPLPLQNGPVAFKPDGTQMIVTGVSYNNNLDRINKPGESLGVFRTELYASYKDSRKNGWSKFKLLFPDEANKGIYSAHPYYINDGNSLLFSSNRPGGYGGMDIYLSNWDDVAKKWGNPINLGPEVNTEGDEIHPTLRSNTLSFSSNGHEGYGGYDIYEAVYVSNQVLNGSLTHMPYPINSVYNDFAMYRIDDSVGYFVSDRNGHSTFDDIYSFKTINTPLSVNDIAGVYDEDAAIRGMLNIISGMNNEIAGLRKNISIDDNDFMSRVPKQGTVLMTLYFDFNGHVINGENAKKLRELIDSDWFGELSGIDIIGYADELGSDQYNKRLSDRRARSVRDFILSKGNANNMPKMNLEGRGRLILSVEDQLKELRGASMSNIKGSGVEFNKTPGLTFSQRIAANKRARKVDIIVVNTSNK